MYDLGYQLQHVLMQHITLRRLFEGLIHIPNWLCVESNMLLYIEVIGSSRSVE